MKSNRIRVVTKQQVDFETLPQLKKYLWLNIKTNKHYRIVSVFKGYDGNRYVALINIPDVSDRRLILFSQFLQKFQLIL